MPRSRMQRPICTCAEEKDRKKEEARQRKKEEEDRKKEEARQRKEEMKKEEAQLRKEEARQQKEEQEEQAPKARGKNKTFDDRMEDLKRFKETHGHANVSIHEDRSLAQFCAQTRHARKNPGKGKVKQLTDENIARLNVLGFNWMSKE